MKAFFDTSILVPLFDREHVHHEASFAAFLGHSHSFCAAHTLAEIYSTLTRLPPPHRTAPDRALAFVGDLRERLTIIALDANEYFDAITDMATRGITGGAVYDGLLIRCALKAKVELIYTWNVRHFRQFGPEVEKRLRTP